MLKTTLYLKKTLTHGCIVCLRTDKNKLRQVKNELNVKEKKWGTEGTYTRTTSPRVFEQVSSASSLFVSQQELLVVFHVKLFQMLDSTGSVVPRNITSTGWDAGRTHIARCCLALRCFESKISTHEGQRELAAVVPSAHSCRLSQVNMRCVHGSAKTMEWNMYQWNWYPMCNLCWHWTWYYYWIGGVPSLFQAKLQAEFLVNVDTESEGMYGGGSKGPLLSRHHCYPLIFTYWISRDLLTRAHSRSTASSTSSWCPILATPSSSRSWCVIFSSCSPLIFSRSKLLTYCWRLSSKPENTRRRRQTGSLSRQTIQSHISVLQFNCH